MLDRLRQRGYICSRLSLLVYDISEDSEERHLRRDVRLEQERTSGSLSRGADHHRWGRREAKQQVSNEVKRRWYDAGSGALGLANVHSRVSRRSYGVRVDGSDNWLVASTSFARLRTVCELLLMYFRTHLA